MQGNEQTLGRRIYTHRHLFVLLLPGLVYFVVYRYAPMFGLLIAFKQYYPNRGVFESEWVGLEHFRRILSTPDIRRVFRNTLLISFYRIAFAFPAPILLAVLINELRSRTYKRVIQSVTYLPHFLSWVIFGEIVKLLLSGSGPVNGLLQSLFGMQEPIYFMIRQDLFRGVLVGSAILKEVGWGTIIYLATISMIDPNLYEAAIVDGAGRFRRIWSITLPGLYSTIAILLILRIGHIMDAGFHQVFVLYNEAVYEVSDIFDTYVYRVGISRAQYSLGTAVGFFKGTVGLILVSLANRFSKSVGEAGVW